MEDDAIDIDQAVLLTGWHRETVLRRGLHGIIPSFKIGKRRFFSKKGLLEYLSKKNDTPKNPEKKLCCCCNHRAVAKGFRMLCRECYTSERALKEDDFYEIGRRNR